MHPIPRSIRPLVPLVALGVAALVSGCSSRPDVLARVGDRTITVDQFRDAAATLAARSIILPDTARMLLLDDMVRRELMLAAAKPVGAVDESVMAQRQRDVERSALAQALLDQMTPHDVGVSDAEVKRLYLWRQQATHVQLVLAPNAATARAARTAIDHGEDFGQVSMRFDPTGTLPPGGDLGFLQPGSLVNPLDRIVRESPVGAIVGPVESTQGWFIVKIVGREAREQAPLEEQVVDLRSMLRQRKQRVALLAAYDDLRTAYQIKTDPAGLRLMYDKLTAARLLEGFGTDPSVPQVSPADRATPIGRWDGGHGFAGVLTLGEALDDLNAGRGGRLQASRLDSYEDWAKNAMLGRVAVVEARRRHLDEEPATAERIRGALDDQVLQAVFLKEVAGKAEPTEAEVLQTYDRNQDRFIQLRSVTVHYLPLPDSALAVSVAERVVQSGSLQKAFLASSANWRVRVETIKFPTHDPTWQLLQTALARQAIGGILGPIHAPDGWRIIEIAARDAPVRSFDQLTPEQQNGLREQARELATERRLKFFTDSLRSAIPVTIDVERLHRIPWPAPNGPERRLPG